MKKAILKTIFLAASCFVLSISPLVSAQESDQLRQVYQTIIDSFETQLAEAKKSGIPVHEIQVLNNGGVAYQYLGEYQKSLELFNQALSLTLQHKAYPQLGSILSQMATVHSKLGDYQGIKFLEQQLAQAKNQGDRDYQREALKYLGIAYISSTEYQKAIAIYEEYLPLIQAINNPREEIFTLSLLATGYRMAGAKDKLQQTLAQINAVAQASEDPEIKKLVLIHQSSWALSQQDISSAISTTEQLIQLSRSSGDIAQERFSLLELARYNALVENYPKVISVLEELLTVIRQGDEPNILLEPQALNYLGDTYALLGNYSKAIELHQQSLAIYAESDRGNNGTSRLFALESLARSQFNAGQLSESWETLQQAIQVHALRRQQAENAINLLGMSRDDLQLNLRESLTDLYRIQQQILIAQNRPTDALLRSEAGRARAFVDLLNLSLAPDVQTPVSPPELTLAQLQAIAKDQNSTLVQYSLILDKPKFRIIQFGKQQPRETFLYIWVIQPNGEITFRSVDLQPFWQKIAAQGTEVTSLGDLVITARESMGAGGRGISFNEDSEAVARALAQIQNNDQKNQQLQQLHEVLIQPIADLLPKNPEARVTFIPQDSLFLVPFPALLDTENTYLIEKHTILTAPSIQVLGLTKQQRQRLSTPTQNALVVGNPTMPSLQFQLGGPLVQLSSLPGAEREARAIAQLLSTRPLIGAQATESTLVEQLPKAGIIHLATHGLLDNLMGFQSSLALTPGGEQDGFLTAREILQLKLNAHLVVLSACDTGRGRISGDGVVGLSRSFIAAGVPSVIVSLWKVPDEPTASLMQAFYQNLQQDPDKAKALRNAMLSALEQYPDPKDWAAFTLIGEAD